jgi:putative transposase
MPERDHLRRLSTIWVKSPVYFLTACTYLRRPILHQAGIPGMLIDSWRVSPAVSGWRIGRYVVMPDHVHFFAQPTPDGKILSNFVRDWKRWTSISQVMRLEPPIWQAEFFDHLLRSAHSYEQKWNYVRENPVRAGLVAQSEDWPHAGECEHLSLKL